LNEPLPELQDAVIDVATLQALVADLLEHAAAVEVRTKGGSRTRADQGTIGLEGAVAALLAGETHGVQIRYRFEDTEWSDTLIRVADGVRLVRTRML